MIYQNADINGINCTYVKLGHGDIGFINGEADGDPILCMVNLIDKKPIGEKIRVNPTIEEEKPQLIIKFEDIKSLDVMIYYLMNLRNIHSL